MENSIKGLFILMISIGLIGCGSKDVNTPGEREAADVSDRPDWTMSNEPEEDDANMFFVGISAVHA